MYCVSLRNNLIANSYIYSEDSRDQLRITRGMFTKVLTYYQVMPVFLDFIFGFGAHWDARELRFGGFCKQVMIDDLPRVPAIHGLGRSGRHFQLCYNLKGVALKRKVPGDLSLHEWSVRQAAFHHQFDIVHGTTLWIVTKGRLDLQQRFKQLTGRDGQHEDKSFGDLCACFRSSLAVHLMFCHWSIEDWRGYIGWLEDVVDSEVGEKCSARPKS